MWYITYAYWLKTTLNTKYSIFNFRKAWDLKIEFCSLIIMVIIESMHNNSCVRICLLKLHSDTYHYAIKSFCFVCLNYLLFFGICIFSLICICISFPQQGFKLSKQSMWRSTPNWQAVSANRYPAGHFLSNQQSLGLQLAQLGRDASAAVSSPY